MDGLEAPLIPDTRALRSDLEWLHLISVLRERKQSLVKDFLARFDGSVVYGGKVPIQEVESLLDSTMDMYLTLLAGEPLDPALEQLPVDLGRKRARQGVRADQLLQGVRTNSQVIWNALQEVADEGAAGCLVRNTGVLLSLVEWHVQEVQHAYLREEELLSRLSERRLQNAVAKIFDPLPLTRDDLNAVARNLGIPAEATYDVLVQIAPHMDDCHLCAIRTGSKVFVHQLPQATVHFRKSDEVALGSQGDGVHAAALSGVQGLSRIREAAETGLSIMHAVGQGAGTVTIAEAWAVVAWEKLSGAIAEDLLPVNLNLVRTMRAEPRERLLQTVTTYFETGSIKETAKLLFCHRNTVVKRLDTFEELLGVDLNIPNRCALAVLALAALRTDREGMPDAQQRRNISISNK